MSLICIHVLHIIYSIHREIILINIKSIQNYTHIIPRYTTAHDQTIKLHTKHKHTIKS